MSKRFKENLILVAVGVVLLVLLMNIGAIAGFLKSLVVILLPIFVGLIISFVLNVPMRALERLFARLLEKKSFRAKEKLITVVSLLLTLLLVVFVIFLAFKLALPEIVSSVKSIYIQIEQQLPRLIEVMNSYNIDTTVLSDIVKNLNFESFISTITSGAGNILSSLWSFASTTVSGITTTIFALVISVYVLLDKKTLARHVKKILYSIVRKEYVDRMCEVGALSVDIYSKFLSSQSIEAVILGVMIFISFSIFGLPYAALIAFLTSFFAFVPYVGAFASCAIGAFLILLDSPEKVITCLIVYLVVQFVENQFIYPHVVGTSVGLSPLWTLVAAIIGGNLFGIVGIIFFIPFTAVVYTVFKRYANNKLDEKSIDIK